MKKKSIIAIIFSVVLVIVIAAFIVLLPKIKGYLPFFYDKMGIKQEDKPYTLIIDKYEYENEVAIRLAENGVVCSSYRFLGYFKKNHADFEWKTGVYQLNANMSYKELFKALSSPSSDLNYVKFTVPEGTNIRGIAAIVEKSGLCSASDFLAAADSYDYNYSFIEDLKKRDQSLIGYKLEGFLFPATYEFRADTVTPKEIVDEMLKAFCEYVDEDMIKKAKDMGLTVNEFITLGSVVQAEAFSKESMKYVASVFWNRLNSTGVRQLQSDPTTTYAKALSVVSHYSSNMKAAYDTYSCIGLPIGPTNCPGTDVLTAVLNPAKTDYYYFVTDKNGKFYYNETYQGHNKTIRNLVDNNLWG